MRPPKLGFTAQPNAATSSQAFPIQPVVAVQDAGGNTVTSGANSNATVTLAIGTNPAGGTLTCTSGLTRAAVAGVATFSGLPDQQRGRRLHADRHGDRPDRGDLDRLHRSAPGGLDHADHVGADRSRWLPTITWGGGITLTTQFGTNGGNKTFQLQATRDNVTWFDIGPLLTTDAAGRDAFAFRPSTNFFYRAVFAGTARSRGRDEPVRADRRPPDRPPATDERRRHQVDQPEHLDHVLHGGSAVATRADAGEGDVLLLPAERRPPGSSSTQRTVTAAPMGEPRTTFKFSTSGQWYVRSMANPTPYNANSVMSPIERYSVN